MNHALLVNQKVVLCEMLEWARFFENINNRRVAHTDINADIRVSTVFLGLDHNYAHQKDYDPIKCGLWFESMVFGGPDDQEIMERYTTYEEALAGHERIVKRIDPTVEVEKLRWPDFIKMLREI